MNLLSGHAGGVGAANAVVDASFAEGGIGTNMNVLMGATGAGVTMGVLGMKGKGKGMGKMHIAGASGGHLLGLNEKFDLDGSKKNDFKEKKGDKKNKGIKGHKATDASTESCECTIF